MKRILSSLCAGVVGCVFGLQFQSTADGREKVLHSFGSGADGVGPVAGLIDVNGTLYGTTGYGGTHCNGVAPCGTVFALDLNTGTEKVLYSFCSQKNCTDGQWPTASLIDVNGTLYGTTVEGGSVNCNPYGTFVGCGTVFALDPNTGAETVVHSFAGSRKDGAGPLAGLIDVNGTLYGTTDAGGANCKGTGGCGTVFSLDPTTGAETVLYSFCAQKNGRQCPDGSEPAAPLVDVNGTLYGTTQAGGAYTRRGGYGYGTVFALDLKTGKEKVVHSFGSSDADGTFPFAGLIDVKGTLYGTTVQGGSRANRNYCAYGCGTVFSLGLVSGVETVLYAFCSQERYCKDGDAPDAGVIDVKGTLYSTTLNGGAYGLGLLFALTPDTGAETVLHAFGNGTDGVAPNGATLIHVNGKLYGTTNGGGVYGYGTVYALRP